MGWSQYAGLYYGLPLCNNFVKTLSPEIRKHFIPFLNTNLGGILTLSRPQFLMTGMVLDTDVVIFIWILLIRALIIQQILSDF
jgi:hypothetical protein